MARPKRVEEIARRFEAAQRAKILAAWDTLSKQIPVDEVMAAMRQGVEAVTALLVSAQLADRIIAETVMPLVEAMRAGGVNAAGAFRIAFDLPDPQGMSRVLSTADVKDWLRYNVTPEDREYLRTVLQDAFMEGGHPYETARLIRNHIGVNRVQQGALNRFARGLPASMTPTERERAIARQTERYIRSRADMIARTETMRAAREGQELAWQQAIAEGELDPDGAYRLLIPAGDACDICAQIAADSEAGMYPLSSSLPETHPACRCSEGLTFELAGGR